MALDKQLKKLEKQLKNKAFNAYQLATVDYKSFLMVLPETTELQFI